MRVALLLGSGNPSFGGVERHVIHLANSLVLDRHAACIVMGRACPVDVDHGLRPEVDQIRVAAPDGASLSAFVAGGGRAVRTWRADVLHSHLTYGLALGVLLRTVLGIPLVHTEHFLVRKSADRGVRGAAGALLRGRADALICVSGTVAAACPVLGGHPRRHMIYNGTAPAASENATPSRGRLLYVGRLEPDKRVGLTLEIARRLQSDGYSLDVVGTGTLAESLRGEAADLLAAGRVRFHGWQADVAPFFRNAAVLLHPAREGLGYAAIEAMAHGVPVVAPRSSGTAELIAHTGLGVAVDDEQRIGAWAEAVARASALPRATAALPAAFHVRHMCAATMDVYEALLRSTAHAATGEAHPAATPKALHGHGARTRL